MGASLKPSKGPLSPRQKLVGRLAICFALEDEAKYHQRLETSACFGSGVNSFHPI